MKYRKKPVIIDAIQWTGNNTFQVRSFLDGQEPNLKSATASDHWEKYCDYVMLHGITIMTLEDGKDGRAKHVASVGDWIIKGVAGEFYPCKPDIFEKTYEIAE